MWSLQLTNLRIQVLIRSTKDGETFKMEVKKAKTLINKGILKAKVN